MTYSECLAYLDRLGNEVLTMKFGLSTIGRLCRDLGSPERRFPSVLIAGTNGKGSTARFLAAGLSACGLRTGLYTSPHLVRIRERIRIDGEQIQEEAFARCFSRVAVAAQAQPAHPTFFEMVTATGFLHFAESEIEAGVLEVGMGGRLDSTNVVEPLVSVLTPIGLDHQRYLGDTIGKIAGEKAGILRAGRTAWSSPQCSEAETTLRQVAAELGAELRFADPNDAALIGEESGRARFRLDGVTFRLSTPGIIQVQNAVLAARVVQELGRSGWPVDLATASAGMGRVLMPGVMQLLAGDPPVYLDGGHNPDAALGLSQFVGSHLPRPRSLVFGIMSDKDAAAVLGILAPCFDRILLTLVDSPRAARPESLEPLCPGPAEIVADPMTALSQAKSGAASVLVAGSFYLVGQLLKEMGFDL